MVDHTTSDNFYSQQEIYLNLRRIYYKIIRWNFLLWWSRMLPILLHCRKCMNNSSFSLFWNALTYFGYQLFQDRRFTSFYFFVWFYFLQLCGMNFELLRNNIWIHIDVLCGCNEIRMLDVHMLVWCEVPAPVKVLWRKLSLSTTWIFGLPISSLGWQIFAFCRSQRADQFQRWRISA